MFKAACAQIEAHTMLICLSAALAQLTSLDALGVQLRLGLILLNNLAAGGGGGLNSSSPLLFGDQLQERCEHSQVAVALIVSHANEVQNSGKPINVVGDDGAVGGRVLPAKNGVKDTPATTAIHFRVATINVPHALGDIVRTSTRSGFAGITTGDLTPLIIFDVPAGFGEEAGSDEVEETGRYDQENLDGSSVATTEWETCQCKLVMEDCGSGRKALTGRG